MNKYQRSLLNKMDALSIELQSDWTSGRKLLTRRERAQKEQQLKEFQAKLNKSYE